MVSRTSRCENDVQNGWTVGSRRMAPSSKPSVGSTSSAKARCSSTGKSPVRKEASTSGAAATSSVSAGRSTSNTAFTSLVFISGS